MGLTKLEFALVCAAKAFAACYQGAEEVVSSTPKEEPREHVESHSNGIPNCRIHGKEMRPSKYGNGYYCSVKDDRGVYCKEKGFASE